MRQEEKKVKLLVIPGYTQNIGEANWICLNELLESFNEYPDVSVKIAGTALNKKTSNVTPKQFVLYIKKILNWPVINPVAAEKCYREIVDALSEDSYDAMLVMHMPYDSVLAACRAKKRFPKVKLFLYELDPITYEIDKQRKSFGRYLYFMRVLAEKRTFKACDRIFHMECNRKKYDQKEYDIYRSKFEYLDFPLIHHNGKEQQNISLYEGQSVRFVYAGKLMSHFRSPSYLLDVLDEVKKEIDITVHFYSSGDCETQISEFADCRPWVKQHGYVDKETLGVAMDSNDCLVNIGNKISDMLPSKLLTYIETGMPILHVKNQVNDACVSYLKNYDLAVIIDESDSIADSAEKLISFIRDNYGKRLSGDRIVNEYCKNTPEYSVKQIYTSIL